MHLTRNHRITLDQLCQKLGGRSRSSIYRDLEHGRLPKPIRVDARLYWDEEEVDFYISTRPRF